MSELFSTKMLHVSGDDTEIEIECGSHSTITAYLFFDQATTLAHAILDHVKAERDRAWKEECDRVWNEAVERKRASEREGKTAVIAPFANGEADRIEMYNHGVKVTLTKNYSNEAEKDKP